jgi:Double zinc ribbon
MRRERRMLARQREIEIRDVGGLAVEMARRDRFRPELIFERANDVLRVEQRMNELDGLLIAVGAASRGRPAAACRCGAPLLPGAHFCSNCGRPASTAPPVLTCSHCGQPLPADTNFCAFCGNPVAAGQQPPDSGDTTARRWSAPEGS